MALPHCHQTLFPSLCRFIQWDEVWESCWSPTGSFLAVNALPSWQATSSPPAGHCWQRQTMILACQLFASFELTGVEMASSVSKLGGCLLSVLKRGCGNMCKSVYYNVAWKQNFQGLCTPLLPPQHHQKWVLQDQYHWLFTQVFFFWFWFLFFCVCVTTGLGRQETIRRMYGLENITLIRQHAKQTGPQN